VIAVLLCGLATAAQEPEGQLTLSGSLWKYSPDNPRAPRPPCSHARIYLKRIRVQPQPTPSFDVTDIWSAVSDLNGEWRISGLPPGSYYVSNRSGVRELLVIGVLVAPAEATSLTMSPSSWDEGTCAELQEAAKAPATPGPLLRN
jgi:hypothetical protein